MGGEQSILFTTARPVGIDSGLLIPILLYLGGPWEVLGGSLGGPWEALGGVLGRSLEVFRKSFGAFRGPFDDKDFPINTDAGAAKVFFPRKKFARRSPANFSESVTVK